MPKQLDVTLNESFTGLYTVPSTYPDLSYYHIAKINGGSFTLTVDDANSGSFSWEPPSGPTLITDIITASESGPFDVLFTKTTGGVILAYHLQLHYKIATHSGILDASVGTWTDIKELTLPAGVTSVDMNVIASVANNFDTFVWNIEEDDLSLTPLNIGLPEILMM
jgi:hypothetical protein